MAYPANLDDGYSETIIVLENMWEAGPELQKVVVERARHPNLKASFDNYGHVLVFSERPAAEWIRVPGEDLRHLHGGAGGKGATPPGPSARSGPGPR